MPASEDDTEIIFLRKARLWHDSTGFTVPINPNPEMRAKALEKQHPQPRFTPTIPQTFQPAIRPPPPANSTPKGIEEKSKRRQTRGEALLKTFNKTASPTSITTHLSTFDITEELARTTECLVRGKYETDAHDSLTHAHRTLKIQVASDSALEKNAQVLGLETASTRGDGNCLQYAVNESHRQQTGKYIADNDNLRLLATALTRAHLLQEAAHLPQSIIEAELRATNAAAHDGSMDYPGTYMNALAAIRHGPLVVLHETP